MRCNRFTLILFFAIASFTAFVDTARAEDFVEGQMKYKVLADGKKDFSYTYDSAEEILTVRLGLVWDNYDPALHALGFNLGKIEDSYMHFPYIPEGCRYYKGYGSIPGAADLENNEVFLEFKGGNCPEILEYFGLVGAAVSFYEVSAWDPHNGKSARAFRLQLFDANQ